VHRRGPRLAGVAYLCTAVTKTCKDGSRGALTTADPQAAIASSGCGHGRPRPDMATIDRAARAGGKGTIAWTLGARMWNGPKRPGSEHLPRMRNPAICGAFRYFLEFLLEQSESG
jgi:hypothetical protein